MRMRHVFICGLLSSKLFSTLSHKRYETRKHKLLNTMYVFRFSLQFSSETYSNKNWASFDQQCTMVFLWSTRDSCRILMKLEFSRIPKIVKYQISRKSVHWEPSCYMWTDRQRHTQTDRHEEPISRFFTILRKRRKTNKEIGKYILHPYIG